MGDPNFKPTRNPAVSTPRRSDSATGTPIPQGALVESAYVVSFDTRTFMVDVRTEKTYKPVFDVPFAVPYCSRNRGEGINFFPEVGSCCYVCTPSEHKAKPFVLCWIMPPDEFGHRGRRQLLNPGDLHFSTRDGNFVFIRRGGIVQIGATPICQTIYLPLRNIMQQLAENYELHTPGGDLTWTVNRKEDSGEGHKGTTFMLAAHEYADDSIKSDGTDPLSVALLKIGSHGDSNPTILTLRTRDKGGGTVKMELTVDKTGALKWVVQKAVSFDFKDDFNLLVAKSFNLVSQLDTNLESKTALNIKAPQLNFACGNMTMSMGGSSGAMNGPAMNFGDATGKVVVDTGDLTAWFAKVQAAFAAITASPQNVPPPTNYLSGKVKA